MTWMERKAERREYFERYVKGWKQVKCPACNGSGRYDHNGAPACGLCDGTGKIKEPPMSANQQQQK